MKRFFDKKLWQAGGLLASIILPISATAIMPFEGIYNAPLDKTLADNSFITYKPVLSLSDKAQQDWVFAMVNYFSIHMPYSQAQFEQYFGTKFYPKNDKLNPDATELPLYTDDTHLNIANIDFRDRIGGQLLIINLRNAVCFPRDEFENLMQKQGYDFDFSPPMAYFSKKMPNHQGQMSLGLAEIKDKSLSCVDSLIFDTFPD